MTSGDRGSIGDFAERESIDYVIFGAIQDANNQILIGASVYSRGEGRVTVSQTVTSDSVLEVFEATDKLTLEFLFAFSGQRIAVGELRLIREGWPSGASEGDTIITAPFRGKRYQNGYGQLTYKRAAAGSATPVAEQALCVK